MKIEPRRTFKYYYLKFIRLKGEPYFLARGVAIGMFVGITPTIPFHTVGALGLSILLRGSRVAAVLSTFIVSNPFTFFIQYFLSWQIGNWLLPGKHSWEDVSKLIDLVVNGGQFRETLVELSHVGFNSLSVLVVGGVVLAIPFAVAFYYLSYVFFSTIRKKRIEKKQLK